MIVFRTNSSVRVNGACRDAAFFVVSSRIPGRFHSLHELTLPPDPHLLFALAAATLLAGRGSLAAAPGKPNVILIFADDMGWQDAHCYEQQRDAQH